MGLPSELWIEIFELCASNDSAVPLALTNVCRRWKDIVESNPRLWYYIVIDYDHLRFWQQHAHKWMDFSFPLKLIIELDTDDTSLILPLISPFILALHRCTLIKPGTTHENYYVPSVPYHPIHLTIQLSDHEFTVPGPLVINPSTGYLINRIPYLPSPDLLPSSLPFATVTLLEYTDVQSDELEPMQLLDLLRHFPVMDAFTFHGWPHECSPHPPVPVVELPELRQLTLSETCLTRSILSNIYAPSLHTLCLFWLNIGFALSEYESLSPGDSDDESFDPSQSPSSDHITGMGLRTFITRHLSSTPPITKLVMEMSDMRTKDFKFCFDHLHLLEEFTISGSDMSDKVVNMLRPYTAKDNLTARSNSPVLSGSGEHSIRRVRLPRLNTIVLRECQMLSGDAIVGAFSDRIIFTDTAGDDTSTLRHVGIVNCQNFSDGHVMTLGLVIGTRLHTSL